MDIKKLKVGSIFTNKDIYVTFQCGNMGGMRRSRSTGTLVIISDHTKMYDDKWYGNELHYTGMGKIGDQVLEGNQNKTLAESDKNGVEVHLFEVFKATQYVYQGVFTLSGIPYQTLQIGEDNHMRKVWIFPLKGKNQLPMINEKYLMEYFSHQDALARSMDIMNLRTKAEMQSKRNNQMSHRIVMTDTYIRDPYIARYTKERAHGICQLCGKSAPFQDINGDPYLESHHIIWLSQGGKDTIENTVALCPNCHRKMHVVKSEEDVKILQYRNMQRK